jgi:pyruvate formate lyase activating enzyme
MSVDEIIEEVLKDRIFYDDSGGGVTFSGGEPMLQETFLLELLKACRKEGIHTTLDTSGFADKESMSKISDRIDLFLYDLKIIRDEKHIKYTGVSNKSILENLKLLYSSGKEVILRFPVIPGITDTHENIIDIKKFINNLQILKFPNPQISLLPFHTMAREKYRRFCKSNLLEGIPDLKQEDLLTLKTEFESIGIQVTIGG